MDKMRVVLVVFVVVLASLHSASTFPSQDEQEEFQETVRTIGLFRPGLWNPLRWFCRRLSSFLTYAAGLKVPLDNNLASANTSQLFVTALSEMCKTRRAVFGRQDEPDELLESTPYPLPPMASQPPPPPPEGSGPPPDGPQPQPPMVDEDMSPIPPL